MSLNYLEKELNSAGLSCHKVIRREKGIYIFYDDHRVDETKLDPIFDRYVKDFYISSSSPVSDEHLRDLGLTPESVGKDIWDLVIADGEIIRIEARD